MASAPCAAASTNVQLIDGEVFSQDREVDGGACAGKIVQAALEKVAIGQDGDRGSAAELVLPGGPGGLKVMAQAILCWATLS